MREQANTEGNSINILDRKYSLEQDLDPGFLHPTFLHNNWAITLVCLFIFCTK